MKRIVLVNPNTSASLTTLMVEIARECAPGNLQIEGRTVPLAEILAMVMLGYMPISSAATARASSVRPKLARPAANGVCGPQKL